MSEKTLSDLVDIEGAYIRSGVQQMVEKLRVKILEFYSTTKVRWVNCRTPVVRTLILEARALLDEDEEINTLFACLIGLHTPNRKAWKGMTLSPRPTTCLLLRQKTDEISLNVLSTQRVVDRDTLAVCFNTSQGQVWVLVLVDGTGMPIVQYGTFGKLVRDAGGISNFTSGFHDGDMTRFMNSCSNKTFSDPETTSAVSWRLGRRVWPIENYDDESLFKLLLQQPMMGAVPLEMRMRKD